jgi:hypothetical protein
MSLSTANSRQHFNSLSPVMHPQSIRPSSYTHTHSTLLLTCSLAVAQPQTLYLYLGPSIHVTGRTCLDEPFLMRQFCGRTRLTSHAHCSTASVACCRHHFTSAFEAAVRCLLFIFNILPTISCSSCHPTTHCPSRTRSSPDCTSQSSCSSAAQCPSCFEHTPLLPPPPSADLFVGLISIQLEVTSHLVLQ